MIRLAALCIAVVAFSTVTHAANSYKTNPFGLSYSSIRDTSSYGKPGGLLITSVCNRYEPACANGAEILTYLAPADVLDQTICSLETQFYSGVTFWPWPSYGKRIAYPNTHLADLRRGSAWSNKVVAYVEALMREDKVDGVMLDAIGARLWNSLAAWDSWPQWEKDAWTDGTVDLVRRLDASRRRINPRFIIVNNSNWDRYDSRGLPGEQYVDGVVNEHHPISSGYHRAYVGRTFSNLGHRRVLVIAKSIAEAAQWLNVQGVTHVSDQASYGRVTLPVVQFNRLTDRPRRFGKATSGSIYTSGLVNNYKRGSRFTLTSKGRLLNMAAYMDGNGGPSGSQSLRMTLYGDSSGKPGSLVAQSHAVTVAAGSGSRWVYFSGPQTALNPGAYWMMIHSGSPTAVARVKGDAVANLNTSADAYSDGAANPAGTGSLGTMTLSLFAHYTVGW